jgi:hypothetical protein
MVNGPVDNIIRSGAIRAGSLKYETNFGLLLSAIWQAFLLEGHHHANPQG